jgi:hypothetical protein
MSSDGITDIGRGGGGRGPGVSQPQLDDEIAACRDSILSSAPGEKDDADSGPGQ